MFDIDSILASIEPDFVSHPLYSSKDMIDAFAIVFRGLMFHTFANINR